MDNVSNRQVGFHGQYVRINYCEKDSETLVDFLCKDLPSSRELSPQAVFDILFVGSQPIMSLCQGTKQLYFGDSRYDLAYTLLNEITYQCITDNSAGHAIHAGAVRYQEGSLLMPGVSGSGKSTLTTWLVANGAQYLTDELVMISGNDNRLHPFTRPISIKTGAIAALAPFLHFAETEVLTGTNGFMLPHRLVNNNFSAQTPPLSAILFPKFTAGSPPTLTQLTSGVGCSRLLECYVNARNIQGHGISQLAAIARKTEMFELTYSSFTGLREVFAKTFPGLLQ